MGDVRWRMGDKEIIQSIPVIGQLSPIAHRTSAILSIIES